jgi:putative N6-adenine-specific DNA methylase
MEKLFAVCGPGLETILADELRQLGLLKTAPEKVSPTSGGVAFKGNLDAVYKSNLWLRTASRVLVRLGNFNAAAFSELRKKASRLRWERYLTPGQPVALKVTCRKSRLYHSDAVAERVAGAIGDRLGKPVRTQKPDDSGKTQLILVRLYRDHCTISIDTSGALLHRRGYRLASAKAPLRETLAAGMLLASGWVPTTPLLDPFCGSGTIAIEAALLAHNIPPGYTRKFAFMKWSNFDSKRWNSLLELNKQPVNHQDPQIIASDRDAGAIEVAKANAERAGMAECIEFSQRALSAIEPEGTGWVVTNPPYGRRVSANKDLRNLYAQIGNVLRAKCPGWQTAILSGDKHLLNQTGLKLDTSLKLDNGGLTVMLGQGIVPK